MEYLVNYKHVYSFVIRVFSPSNYSKSVDIKKKGKVIPLQARCGPEGE